MSEKKFNGANGDVLQLQFRVNQIVFFWKVKAENNY
jgi:hypothetical protein